MFLLDNTGKSNKNKRLLLHRIGIQHETFQLYWKNITTLQITMQCNRDIIETLELQQNVSNIATIF